jgi:DNA-binding NarL/FixJ family response regulator
VLFAEAIAAAMSDDGLGVVGSVGDGRGAIEFLEREHVDVVLMDIGLPDRSGLAIAGDILERWPDTKILAVTALDDPRVADDALRMGFAGYVTKDTSVDRFTASVRAVMDGQVVLPRRLIGRIRSSRGSTHASGARGPRIARSRSRWRDDRSAARYQPEHGPHARPEHPDEAAGPLQARGGDHGRATSSGSRSVPGIP